MTQDWWLSRLKEKDVIINASPSTPSDPATKKFAFFSSEDAPSSVPAFINSHLLLEQASNWHSARLAGISNPGPADILASPATRQLAEDLLNMSLDECLCLTQEELDELEARIKLELGIELTASLTLSLTLLLEAALTISLPPILIPLILAAVLAALGRDPEVADCCEETLLYLTIPSGDGTDENGFEAIQNGRIHFYDFPPLLNQPDKIGRKGILDSPYWRVAGRGPLKFVSISRDTSSYCANNWKFVGFEPYVPEQPAPPYRPTDGTTNHDPTPPVPGWYTPHQPEQFDPYGGGSSWGDSDEGASGGFDYIAGGNDW